LDSALRAGVLDVTQARLRLVTAAPTYAAASSSAAPRAFD